MAACSSSLAIALGANLDDPLATLLVVRPRLEALLADWAAPATFRCRWSPLFRTAPVGGPADQPDYINAALLLEPCPAASPLLLLQRLLELERHFGRVREQRWGPRRLDLDLLWCGSHCSREPQLLLPHPRLAGRAFVLAPLAAIDPDLAVPLPAGGTCRGGALLAALLPSLPEPAPLRLEPRPGWPEAGAAAAPS
ncbi:MAG: 2-amino-4-hydroxy-6-hydroxymethyldihydropteridine diphosphokinase [Synechococcaceae cyanobacterium]|nr:2-amino-4-hydroxy-6-hydroxymethyldihydropteridine diphosphokinase [Synechococcaceae cyanobacterium]